MEKNSTVLHMDLLQKIDYSESSGWSCEKKISRFSYYCGVYGHFKVLEVPEVELPVPISPEDCRKYVNTKKYKSMDGTSHLLTVPGETILSLNEKGVIHEKGSVSCDGEQVKINNEIIDRIIVLAQHRIIIRRELYKLTSGKPVEVISQHKKLPKTCRPKLSSCVTDLSTYIWTPTLQRCSLQKIQSLKVQVEGEYLVDHFNKIILKRLGAIPSPSGCPPSELHSTPYTELFVTKSGLRFPQFDSTAIHTEIFVRGLSDYSLYIAERKLASALQQNQVEICAQSLDITDKRHHQVKDDVFAQRRADILYIYKCRIKSGIIKTAKRCYQDIPMESDQNLFVDPITKISKTISAPATCNIRFPLQLLTEENQWIKVTPELERIDAPESKPIDSLRFTHESLDHGGTYLESQWKDWRTTIEEQSYQDALVNTLSYGNQVNMGLVNDEDFNYDFNLLKPLDKLADSTNIFRRVDDFLNRYGSYLSLFVILLEGAKLIITILMLCYSFTLEGLTGLLYIGRSLCCSQWDTVNEKSRHARKEHAKRKRRQERAVRREHGEQTSTLMSDMGTTYTTGVSHSDITTTGGDETT